MKIACKSSEHEHCIYVYSESVMFHVTPNENGSSAFLFLYIEWSENVCQVFRLTVYFRIRVNYTLAKMWHFDIKWNIFYDCTETSILLWLPEWNDWLDWIGLDWIFHQAGHIQFDREITMLIINSTNLKKGRHTMRKLEMSELTQEFTFAILFLVLDSTDKAFIAKTVHCPIKIVWMLFTLPVSLFDRKFPAW